MATESYRQFDAGIISPKSIARDKIKGSTKNSVEFAYNVDFDTVMGYVQGRKGSIKIGTSISGVTDIQGITALRTFTNNIPVVATSNGSNSNMYYWNGSAWTASTGWTSKGLGQHRFAQLGGSLFVVNGVNDMMSSTNGASWVTTNCPTSLVLSYITRYRGRLVAMTTDGTVYFSSIINPSVSPFITWTPSTNFFRVNPDDGGYASGFATVGNVLLIFKNNGFYRTDITNEFVTPDDLYQVGAVSQEAITVSQGYCFFYSGTSVYKTDGSAYPADIARPIQAYIDLISNKSDVYMTSNEHYVYLEVGSIVIDGITYGNVVFRYSIRNDSWTIFGYPYRVKQLFYNDKDNKVYSGSSNNIYEVEGNYVTDNTTPIAYEVIFQELDGGMRGMTKSIQNNLAIYTKNANGSNISVTNNEGKIEQAAVVSEYKVARPFNITGNWFKVSWSGIVGSKLPIFEGLDLFYDNKGIRK